ncbi:tetratricopeptide repeat protein [Nonomuraea sp. NPDC050383]|uniref:tetratricopeptide repeat protein n=1 Tax=Nonomuraea sp. NPDC050383 TaxID=3364362 RepID=UPI0037BB3AAE
MTMPSAPVAGAIQRARALLELSRPADAERELRGVLAEAPEHATAHAYLAVALDAQSRGAEAVAEAHEAVRLAPEHWFTHYIAAQVHRGANRLPEAVAAARASLALSPEEALTWEVLARAHLQAGQWREAAEAAGRGLAVAPEESDLASLLALALSSLGDAAQARETASRAVALSPENPLAHLAYGQAALAAGDPGEAASAFREVLRLNPGFDTARGLLLTALKQRNPVYRVLSRLRERFFGRGWLVLLLPAMPGLIAAFVLIALLHWGAWVAEAFTTLRLARGKTTRLLFASGDVRQAALCCGLPVAGAVVLTLGAVTGLEAVATAGGAVMALVTPVQEAAHTGSRRARKLLYGWSVLLAVAVAASVPLSSAPMALLTAYAALATIWIAAGVRRFLGT